MPPKDYIKISQSMTPYQQRTGVVEVLMVIVERVMEASLRQEVMPAKEETRVLP
jgi:hypothetical protein